MVCNKPCRCWTSCSVNAFVYRSSICCLKVSASSATWQKDSNPDPSTPALLTRQCLPLNIAFNSFSLTPVLLKEGNTWTWALLIMSCISLSLGFATRQVCWWLCASCCSFFDGFLPVITKGNFNWLNTFFNNQVAACSFSLMARLPW